MEQSEKVTLSLKALFAPDAAGAGAGGATEADMAIRGRIECRLGFQDASVENAEQALKDNGPRDMRRPGLRVVATRPCSGHPYIVLSLTISLPSSRHFAMDFVCHQRLLCYPETHSGLSCSSVVKISSVPDIPEAFSPNSPSMYSSPPRNELCSLVLQTNGTSRWSRRQAKSSIIR